MRRRWILLSLWLVAGVGMWFISGAMPVSRTQEGRVLETAREMVGQPLQDWLIPRLNGAVRLRKPPLAYWLSAMSFSLFGVGDRAGRFPAVLCGWSMIGLIYAIGRRLFDPRVAVLAAAICASSYLSLRHGMLAETDIYAALFVTAGVYALLRADGASRQQTIVWFNLLAVCMAGAVLAKGPPAGYLAIFALLRALERRSAKLLLRFFTSGAIVTLLILALPWFWYVARHSTAQSQLGVDLNESVEGANHSAPAIVYIPLLLRATLPWTAVWLVALAIALRHLGAYLRSRRQNSSNGSDGLPTRETVALRTLAAWAASILLPLLFWGNKQFHYLLPVMPPAVILTGWAVDRAIRRVSGFNAIAIVTGMTCALLGLGGIAALIAAARLRPPIEAGDVVLAACFTFVAFLVAIAWRRGGMAAGALGTALLSAGVLTLGISWIPSLVGDLHLRVIHQLAADFPGAQFAYRKTDLPALSYAMRQAVPSWNDATIEADSSPTRVVLDQQQSNAKAPQPPAGYVEARCYVEGENWLHAYVRTASPFMSH